MKDNTDRNRTSPFAFTGNKFEFRAVGSSASTAFPVTLVNAAVADGFAEDHRRLCRQSSRRQELDGSGDFGSRSWKRSRKPSAIRFEGNSYSEEWVKEAAKRGLPNLRKTPEALAQIVEHEVEEALTSASASSPKPKSTSRFHVRIERYVKNLLIEVDTLRHDGRHAGPAGLLRLPHAARRGRRVRRRPRAFRLRRAEVAGARDQALGRSADQAHRAREASAQDRDAHERRGQGQAPGQGRLERRWPIVRAVCDELEAIVADDFWPLPKYREMLVLVLIGEFRRAFL